MEDQNEIIRILRIERECISRDCNRMCEICDLVQDRGHLLSVYTSAIKLIEDQQEEIKRLRTQLDEAMLWR